MTSVAFKPWMNHVDSYLMHEPDYRHFFKGGVYATWIAASRSPNDIQGRILLTDMRDEDINANVKMLEDTLGPGMSLAQARAGVENADALKQARMLVRDALKARRNADLARVLMNCKLLAVSFQLSSKKLKRKLSRYKVIYQAFRIVTIEEKN